MLAVVVVNGASTAQAVQVVLVVVVVQVAGDATEVLEQLIQVAVVAVASGGATLGRRRLRYSNRKVCNLTKGIICPRIM
jgi:hypothetical protein